MTAQEHLCSNRAKISKILGVQSTIHRATTWSGSVHDLSVCQSEFSIRDA